MSLLTYALDESQALVHVDDVPKGLKCGCSCPHCGAKLDGSSSEGEDEEPPILVTYTTKHNYYIKLESGNQKIIDANEFLPYEINKKFKTTVDNQKIVELVILSDAEGGTFEKIASGFFTIADNLPADSNLTFTFISCIIF